MSVFGWCRQHRLATDILIAVLFALTDTGATLAGATWWPAHPDALAWWMLALQAAADLTLAARRRAPLLVVAVLAAATLTISLLISPAGALTPAHPGNIWLRSAPCWLPTGRSSTRITAARPTSRSAS
jgi:hypothetical protein